jgi:hypothetical protein
MTDDDLDTYFDPLTNSDRAALERRLERHRDRLEAEGYELAIADGEHGLFAGVLVIDRDQGRFGFLEPSGEVAWLGGGLGGIGALGTAVAQNPTDRLEEQLDPDVEGLENADIE